MELANSVEEKQRLQHQIQAIALKTVSRRIMYKFFY
jgi:hypothetical protein